MSLSDCEKCWETPCRCGYGYQSWTPDALAGLITTLQDVLAEKAPAVQTRTAAEERLAECNSQLAERNARVLELEGMLNTPHIADFLEAVKLEAIHQRERWGGEHDAGKEPADWFWLLGWLAGKAVHAAVGGDVEKALHRTISSGAALLNWHAQLSGDDTRMRPGIEPPSERERARKAGA